MPVQSDSPATPAQDGRRNRTVETRRRIVEALTELIREGQVAPTAEDVSLRAQVGLRTVFRHFDDMETLYREINVELQAMIQSILHLDYAATHWQDRLMEGIRVRGKLYENITPFVLCAQVNRHKSQVINSNFQRSTELERSILKRILPKEIQADKPRFEALVMVLSPDAWMRLRRDQGLSVAAAVAAVQMAVQALIAA